MPRRKKRKISAHQRAFGKIAHAANVVCHRETNSVPAYKSCMRREMRAGLGSKKRSRKKRRR